LASVAIDGLGLRCWARGYLEKHWTTPQQKAVDGLQNPADSTGFVVLGQDAVQAIMAAAFEPRRGRTC
jgi:hypothetical protein